MTDTPTTTPASVTDEEVVAAVSSYLAETGAPAEVTLDSRLEDLGLDSIALVDLLLRCRIELVSAGRLPAELALTEPPPMETVADLRDVLRSLALPSA